MSAQDRAVRSAGRGRGTGPTACCHLPAVMGGAGDNRGRDLAQGLAITGHFLERRLAPDLVGRPLPAARARLVRRLLRPAAGPQDG